VLHDEVAPVKFVDFVQLPELSHRTIRINRIEEDAATGSEPRIQDIGHAPENVRRGHTAGRFPRWEKPDK
jgi:hypothetical protein